jgi:hypothetical protein
MFTGFCNAGVPPAVFLLGTQRKLDGGTPALQKKRGGCFFSRPSWKRFLQTLLGLPRFLFLARSHIRSVNFSPLGAASQSFADSLPFLLRVCAPEVKK